MTQGAGALVRLRRISVRAPIMGGGGAVADALLQGRPLRVLLVEDDDGDALIVEDLLESAAEPVELLHVRTLSEALDEALDYDCALLDLNLPDATGVGGLRRLRAAFDHLAILVLTGLDDERQGVEAVDAGAQDYLVKGRVSGELLSRSLRYAIGRRRADESQRQLALAEAQTAENARLERGLIPTPLVTDRALVSTHYRAGRRRALIGGDFFDVVESADGVVHAIIGDVAGHGPDEAALGVALRIAWRTLTLSHAGPDKTLSVLQEVLEAERPSVGVFTTLATVAIAADRRTLDLRTAGHPSPLLLPVAEGVRPFTDHSSGPPIGVSADATWPPQTLELPPGAGVLLYTDGAVEGRVPGGGRLGELGLAGLVEDARDRHPGEPGAQVREVIEQVEELHGGPLLDDVALVLLAGGDGR